MSIKPSVVFIKGVHSTTGSDKTSDIGFPQLELEKLFEGATLKQVDSGTGYDSNKKYIYKNAAGNVAIQDGGHFNCIKNGYSSIDNNISHYYILSGSDYSYNIVPDVGTWAGKWSFSNTIKDKTLYSISLESDRICINDNYYEKNSNNYINQTAKTYDLYKEGQQVLWNDSHKYIQKVELDTNTLQNIIIWKSGDTLATDGYYLSIDERSNDTFIVKLLNCTFKNGILQDKFDDLEFLYKLDTDNLFGSSTWYIKNENKLEMIPFNTSIVFNTSPTESSNFYLYQNIESYTYPNTEAPKPASLYTDSGSSIYKNFDTNNFPIYKNTTKTKISKTSHDSYIIYEKTAVKINYMYSKTDNSLKFIFTDKTIPEVLKVCGFPNNIGLEKYVHLTNLKYNNLKP